MAIKGLKLTLESIRKAQNWGTFDMLGGGLLVTALKHSKMNDAKALIHDVQYWLQNLTANSKIFRLISQTQWICNWTA